MWCAAPTAPISSPVRCRRTIRRKPSPSRCDQRGTACLTELAGLALAGFGKLPQVGESVRMHGWQFEVVDMDGRRIDKILLTRAVPRRQANS